MVSLDPSACLCGCSGKVFWQLCLVQSSSFSEETLLSISKGRHDQTCMDIYRTTPLSVLLTSLLRGRRTVTWNHLQYPDGYWHELSSLQAPEEVSHRHDLLEKEGTLAISMPRLN